MQVPSWFITVYNLTDPNPSLNDILSFWTGLREVPPMGIDGGLSIKFLPYSSSGKYKLPQSHACFAVIKLPVEHDTQAKFDHHMDRGILESLGYFGRP